MEAGFTGVTTDGASGAASGDAECGAECGAIIEGAISEDRDRNATSGSCYQEY